MQWEFHRIITSNLDNIQQLKQGLENFFPSLVFHTSYFSDAAYKMIPKCPITVCYTTFIFYFLSRIGVKKNGKFYNK